MTTKTVEVDSDQLREAAEAAISLKAGLARLGEMEKALRDLETKANRLPAGASLDRQDERPEQVKTFVDRYLRKGLTEGLGPTDTKSMSAGSDPDGGWMVPQDLDRAIGSVEREETPMRQVATVLPVSNEEYQKLMSVGGAVGGWVGEQDARPETATPTLASIKPSFGEVYANPYVTQKLLDDADFDVAGFLAEEVGLAFAAYENTAFVNGNGMNKAKGLLTYTIKASPAFGELLQIKSGVNSTTTGDKLMEVSLSLKPRYLKGAVWMMSRATLLLIRTLKNATTNDYLWRAGLERGQPSTLLGYPVVLNEEMPAPGVGSHSVAFGDFRRGYKIADVRNTRILRDPYTTKGKVCFYTTKRVGGGVEDSTALVIHTFAA